MIKPISWLHLSDVHYAYSNFDTMRMRQQLLVALKPFSDILDFVIISGDLAYQGKPYADDLIEFIKSIMEVCNLSMQQLFIVPGNHDLKRSTPRSLMLKSIHDAPVYSDFDNELEIDLLKSQKAFFSFYKKIFGNEYPQREIHWLYEGVNYNILHLNTALTCGGDNEEGNLKINSSKLLTQVRKLENSKKLNIAVGHHGIDCFSEKEKDSIVALFEDYGVLVYLCGHIHKSKFTVSADGRRDIPTLVCGGNVVDGYATPAFVIESYIPQPTPKLNAKFYCWDKDNFQWVIDTKIGRASVDGTVEFKCELPQEDIEIDDDELRRFIAEFHDHVENPSDKNPLSAFIAKDVKEKFENMRCNKSIYRQYDSMTPYFPIINTVMSTSGFMSQQNRLAVTNIFISKYNAVFDTYDTGTQILEAMVDGICNDYHNNLQYSTSKLRLYIKVMVYWLIYECDIFDDIKE